MLRCAAGITGRVSSDCETFDGTYAVHLWRHSWLPRSVQWFNQHKRYVLATGALALATLIYACLLYTSPSPRD